MKKQLLLVLIVLILSTITCYSAEPPVILSGNVFLNNHNYTGVNVIVKDFESATLGKSLATLSDGKYTLSLPYDNPNTSISEGVKKGQVVQLFVDNKFIRNYTIVGNGFNFVNLSYNTNDKIEVEEKVISGNIESVTEEETNENVIVISNESELVVYTEENQNNTYVYLLIGFILLVIILVVVMYFKFK